MKTNLVKSWLTMVLLTMSALTFGQTRKWELTVLLQPEITFHQDQYAWWKQNSQKTTLNMGVASAIQYNINKRIFVSTGVGFISRQLRTANFLNQAALPAPRRSLSQELVTTETVSYRLLPVSFLVGYNFISTDKFRSFITSGFSANYLLNTYYKSNFERYDGAYSKNEWQGYSLTTGFGADYHLTKRLQATASLSYALVNRVKEDPFITGLENTGLTLAHNYLNLNMGIKFGI
jgi:Outer membrane protein beta-barrel domain